MGDDDPNDIRPERAQGLDAIKSEMSRAEGFVISKSQLTQELVRDVLQACSGGASIKDPPVLDYLRRLYEIDPGLTQTLWAKIELTSGQSRTEIVKILVETGERPPEYSDDALTLDFSIDTPANCGMRPLGGSGSIGTAPAGRLEKTLKTFDLARFALARSNSARNPARGQDRQRINVAAIERLARSDRRLAAPRRSVGRRPVAAKHARRHRRSAHRELPHAQPTATSPRSRPSRRRACPPMASVPRR